MHIIIYKINLKMKTRRGFTLIELLVVIAIIGILSSVVVTSLNSARKKARDARRVDDIKQIQLALDLYFESNQGKYPRNLDSLVTGGFIPSKPIPPAPAGTLDGDYYYAPLSSCTSYHLGTPLEDQDHIALKSKTNATAGTISTSPPCPGTGVANGNGHNSTDFDGTTSGVYDVKP